MTLEEIRNRFHHHPSSAEGADRHELLSDSFSALAKLVDEVCPDGRSKSLAFTKLEEAKFHASAAVDRDPSTR